jgi:hypothetical protein
MKNCKKTSGGSTDRVAPCHSETERNAMVLAECAVFANVRSLLGKSTFSSIDAGNQLRGERRSFGWRYLYLSSRPFGTTILP